MSLDEELRESTHEILRLRRLIKKKSFQSSSSACQTDDPTEAGQVISASVLVRLETFKNVSKAFSQSQDKVNKLRRKIRTSSTIFIFTCFARIFNRKKKEFFTIWSDCVKQSIQDEKIDKTFAMNVARISFNEWRNETKKTIFMKSMKMMENNRKLTILICEFRERIFAWLTDVMNEVRHDVLSPLGMITEKLNRLKQIGGRAISAQFFMYQKLRVLIGELNEDLEISSESGNNLDEKTPNTLAANLPNPFYLRPHRAVALCAKIARSPLNTFENLQTLLPVLPSAVPGFLLKLFNGNQLSSSAAPPLKGKPVRDGITSRSLDSLRDVKAADQLTKLALDALTLFFSDWNKHTSLLTSTPSTAAGTPEAVPAAFGLSQSVDSGMWRLMKESNSNISSSNETHAKDKLEDPIESRKLFEELESISL